MKNFIQSKRSSGFTLIELLVVVAIISLLSSIVLASLNTARQKAKNAAIISEANEFVKLYALEYNEKGSYDNLQRSAWVTATVSTCALLNFSGNYASQATAICQKMIDLGPASGAGTGAFIAQISGIPPNYSSQNYSVVIALWPDLWYCTGSSGRSSINTVAAINIAPGWSGPGCYNNP